MTVQAVATRARGLRAEVYWGTRRAWRSVRLLPAALLAPLVLLLRFARKSPRERLQWMRRYRLMVIARYHLRTANPDFVRAHPDFTSDDLEFRLANRHDDISDTASVHFGDDRTAYLIGLWGSGRHYIKNLVRRNIGERAVHFREAIVLQPGPTSMIYNGHSTVKHVSRGHRLPIVTSRLFESVRLGFADLIFFYRHPLDSLLTNWVCWRTATHGRMLPISDVYRSTDDLCADVEQNFSGLKALAGGDPNFLAELPKGRRFMSLSEFVEEMTLFVPRATLALRVEDFSVDPVREFSKIVDVMSADVDVSRLQLDPPKSQPYRYLAVKEKVPQFRDLIDELDAETKRRIEKLGYAL